MTETQQLMNDLSDKVRDLTTQLDEAKKKALRELISLWV